VVELLPLCGGEVPGSFDAVCQQHHRTTVLDDLSLLDDGLGVGRFLIDLGHSVSSGEADAFSCTIVLSCSVLFGLELLQEWFEYLHEETKLGVDAREVLEHELHLSRAVDGAVVEIQFFHALGLHGWRLLLVHLEAHLRLPGF
jgi:hypothetical protein